MNEDQGSKEWFEKRVGRVTGSRAGAILGLSPFATADDVLREMVREYHGAEREFTGNIATEWGNDHEAEAISAYEDEMGCVVISTGFHKHEDWLGASPDGMVGESGLVEVKAPFSRKITSIEDNPHYYAQIQIELYCTGRDWCDYLCWTPDYSQLDRVKPDFPWMDENLPKLKEFHNRYLAELDNPAHIEPLVADMTSDREWEIAEEAYTNAVSSLEQAKEVVEKWKSDLVRLANGKKAKGRKLQVFPVTRKGSVSYAKALKDLAPGADLSKYQGKPSTSWAVKAL